ncbi:S8 family serine peptidase [Aquabacterium sp.]|uniref:S8 family serine peptidase n=1 Tax=Aquabacterium sp. TaxID=1872578 RepID=UPI003784CF7A
MQAWIRLGVLGVVIGWSLAARADPLVEQETKSAQARAAEKVTGRNVAVAILDRGIDWTHPDFRNADGSTRIAYIFDMTDDSGKAAAGNPYGVGTIYTRAQIDAALAGGPTLATRDAVGHGTATAGNCCGNGRASNGQYTGVAPEATLIIVKFTSDGAPAHDGQPAEPAFYKADLFPKAVDFAIDKARVLGLPLVMLANFGSIGGRADGGDPIAQKIDAVVGPGKPGLVFVTGAGDDGGRDNHAFGTVAAGKSVALQFQKGQAGTVYLQLWYDAADRFTVSVTSPGGSFGPYAAPANNSFDTKTTADFVYGHNGSVYYGGSKRFIYLTLNGPVGGYTLTLTGASIGSGASAGQFEAYLSPASYGANNANRFTSQLQAGKTIWAGATAQNNIAPNSYVFRTRWDGLDGASHSVTTEGAVGDLWAGSSIGPTWDGRVGVDFSAPGERTITTYSPTSYWATFKFNQVADGGGLYGVASAVSAAAPVATGIVALMLQKNPGLDAAAIRAALRSSARSDAFTGAVPNPRFGYGKVDALAALAAIPRQVIAASAKDCLFNWAEVTFPDLFKPAHAVSGTLAPYYYRYYAATGNYVGVSADDNHIYLLGPASGGAILDVGAFADYAGLAGCSTSPAPGR